MLAQKNLESKIIGLCGEEIKIVKPRKKELVLKGTDVEWVHGILDVEAQVKDSLGRIIKGNQALHRLHWVSFPYEWFILPLNEVLPPLDIIRSDEDGNPEIYSPAVNVMYSQVWITSDYFKKPGEYLVKLKIPTIFDYDLELGKRIKLIW